MHIGCGREAIGVYPKSWKRGQSLLSFESKLFNMTVKHSNRTVKHSNRTVKYRVVANLKFLPTKVLLYIRISHHVIITSSQSSLMLLSILEYCKLTSSLPNPNGPLSVKIFLRQLNDIQSCGMPHDIHT